MTLTPTETTWGTPLVAPSRPRNIPVYTRSIGEELYSFVADEIQTWRPTLIIVVERRGTAVLRALKEASRHLMWPWLDVVSSRVLQQHSAGYYLNKRILIFDDMMMGGSHVKEVFEALSAIDPSGAIFQNVRVAVFARHEGAVSPPPYMRPGVTEASFYRALTTPAYRNKRLAIVSMLQSAGSLMLDTEHIEVRVRVNGTFPAFLAALGRKAHVITFQSGGGRRNVTVLYDDADPAHELDRKTLPEHAITSGIVKKCRVVERAGDEFAIIPMCYPSTPDDSTDWRDPTAYVDLLGDPTKQSGEARFYGTALLSALSVLRWALKGLYAAGQKVATVYLPEMSAEDNPADGFTLNHLKVMYPTLNLERLIDAIGAIDAEAAREGSAVHDRHVLPLTQTDSSSGNLRQDAWTLLQMIRHVLDKRIQEEKLFDPHWKRPHPFGLTADEVFVSGNQFGWQRAKTSALFDMLIDDCHLVTHVMKSSDRDGICRWKRVFEPDGEMVSDLVRLYSIQRGLPDGF
jgi:hypothetical protein